MCSTILQFCLQNRSGLAKTPGIDIIPLGDNTTSMLKILVVPAMSRLEFVLPSLLKILDLATLYSNLGYMFLSKIELYFRLIRFVFPIIHWLGLSKDGFYTQPNLFLVLTSIYQFPCYGFVPQYIFLNPILLQQNYLNCYSGLI